MHDPPRTALALGGLALRGTASTRPLCGSTDRPHVRGERMRAPRAGLTAPPPLPTACRGSDGGLGVGRTGQPAGFHALDRLGDPCGLCGWGSRGGCGGLLGPRAGPHDEQPPRFHRVPPVSVCHLDGAEDTLPVPTPWRLRPRPAWLFASQGPGPWRLAPRLPRLPHRTGTGDQGDASHPLFPA